MALLFLRIRKKAKYGSYLRAFYYPKKEIRIQNQRVFWDSTYPAFG